jgi:quinol monooxygenase YgiN
MHVQIITFGLKGVTEEAYAGLCDELAPSYAAVPGLVRKVWLADSENGVFGGVYVWRDRQAMEEFAQTDLFKSVATHPNLDNITSTDYGVLLGPTAVTRGSI